jgi:hypothetical protein
LKCAAIDPFAVDLFHGKTKGVLDGRLKRRAGSSGLHMLTRDSAEVGIGTGAFWCCRTRGNGGMRRYDNLGRGRGGCLVLLACDEASDGQNASARIADEGSLLHGGKSLE